MICFQLFIGFLKVGLFAFGGAYGAIPLIRDVVLSYGWLTDEALSTMIAVSESTPGPIMVNLATYVGSSQAGFVGAVLATAAVVLPAFALILVIMFLLKRVMKNPLAQAALRGIKPCVTGIVLATGAVMLIKNVRPTGGRADETDVYITLALLAVLYAPPLLIKKKLSPIMFIVAAAAVGIAVCAVFST